MTTPPYGAPAYYPQPQRPVGTNGFAITTLCLGILPVCAGIPAVIFGIVALSQIRKSGQKGRGLAIAGLCLVGVWWAAGAIAVAFDLFTDAKRDSLGQITGGGNVSVISLRLGDCVKDLKDGTAPVEVPAVPCEQPHTGEVVGEFKLSGSTYPGEEAITTQARKQCELLLDGYTSRGDEADDLFLIYPRRQDWARGSRTVTCIAYHMTPVTGSLRG